MVHRLALSYYRRLGRWFEYDDLVSIGVAALWRATEHYDPDNPTRAQFQTYAHRCVVFAYNHELKYSMAGRRRDRAFALSIDELTDAGHEFHKHGTGDEPLSSEELLIRREEAAALSHALDALTPREAEVVTSRLQGDTLLEIARQKRVSRERIRQIEKQALQRLSCSLRGSFRERVPRPLAGLSFGADE